MTEAGFTPRQMRAEGCSCSQQRTELQGLGLHGSREAEELAPTTGHLSLGPGYSGMRPWCSACLFSVEPLSQEGSGPAGSTFLRGSPPQPQGGGQRERSIAVRLVQTPKHGKTTVILTTLLRTCQTEGVVGRAGSAEPTQLVCIQLDHQNSSPQHSQGRHPQIHPPQLEYPKLTRQPSNLPSRYPRI